MRWTLRVSFLSIAVWALFPDRYEGDTKSISRSGAFVSTLVACFLAELGDKTQIASVDVTAPLGLLCGRRNGTTLGMMLANIPAVILGDRIADKLPGQSRAIVASTGTEVPLEKLELELV